VRAVLACCMAGLLTACSAAAGARPVERLPSPGVDADQAAADAPEADGGASAVAVPDLPEAARAQDHVGAAAFVRHWWDQFNVAYATGDAAALRAISTQECVFCQSVIDDVEARAAAGERTEGGEISVLDVAAPPDVEAQPAYRVIGVAAQAAGAVRVPGQVEPDLIEPSRQSFDVLVVRDGDHWVNDGVALHDVTDR
jgi:hypothetical protein